MEKKFVLASASLHLGLFLAFALKAVIFPEKPIHYIPSVRVDMVALPDKAPSKPKAIEKSEPKKIKPVVKNPPKPKPKLKKVEPKKKSADTSKAIDRVKALQAIEEMMEEEKSDSKEPVKEQEFKGNVLAAGTALNGLNKLDYDGYIEALDAHVKTYWSLPRWLANSEYKARAMVKMDQSGLVTFREVVQSSGNNKYDQVVLDAIDRASPFPAPPRKFLNLVAIDGIVFGFPE